MIPQPSTPTQSQSPIKVSVKRDPSQPYGICISCAPHTVAPSVDNVLPFLSKEKQKQIACCYSGCTVDYVINRCTYPLSMWQDAIAAEIAHRLQVEANENNLEPTVLNPTMPGDAYIAIGEGVYKLQPVGVAPINKALNLVRRKAMSTARTEADRIIADGKLSVSGIVAEANKRLAEAAAKLRDLNNAKIPPAWTLGYPVRYNSDQGWFEVAIDFDFCITHFDWPSYRSPRPTEPQGVNRPVIRTWASVATAPHFKVKMWVPAREDGAYRTSQCRLDTACGPLPHMKATGSCMTPAMAPPNIKTSRQLIQLRDAVAICLRRVDLSSLYVSYSSWDARAQAMTPPALSNSLPLFGPSTQLDTLSCDSFTDIDTDPNTTFAAAPATAIEDVA
jgi:hypothetical protein